MKTCLVGFHVMVKKRQLDPGLLINTVSYCPNYRVGIDNTASKPSYGTISSLVLIEYDFHSLID